MKLIAVLFLPLLAAGQTPALMQTALHGTAAEMKTLLDRGADPNEANTAGATALMWSVHDLKKVKLLVARGADVNARSKEGRTPLMIAARHNGSIETVRFLLEHGARVNERDAMGGTAMHAAAEAGHLNVINELAQRGAAIDEQAGPLYGIPRFGGGPGGELPKGVGYTPLLCAAQHNHTAAVRYFLEKSADPNRRLITGQTALALAVQQANVEMARALLEKGADANARERRQATPLILAAATDVTPLEMIRLLIAKGGAIDAKDNQGRTAYDFASMRGNREMIAMLEVRK